MIDPEVKRQVFTALDAHVGRDLIRAYVTIRQQYGLTAEAMFSLYQTWQDTRTEPPRADI